MNNEQDTATDSNASSSSSNSNSDSKSQSKSRPKEFPEKEWGTYYDPSNVFCGKYDCYKILGFDYETWGRSPPTRGEITQAYRSMSKLWHPDKNKDEGAKDRFMKINKAYEVLTDNKLRKEFDYMRERPDEYYLKYGTTVLYHYAPKSDVALVIVLFLILGNIFTWYAQKAKWNRVASRVIKDAVDDLKAQDGGSTQSIEIRLKAEEIQKERSSNNSSISNSSNHDGSYHGSASLDQSNGKSNNNTTTPSKASKVRLTKKEIKEKENEALRPIIEELVKEIKDFGAGFHQPTFRDLLIIRLSLFPYHFLQYSIWEIKFLFRRKILKCELSNEEREVLTKRAVGEIAWEAASEEDREVMMESDLWIMKNLEDWLEAQEIAQLSSGKQKQINRLKKKQAMKGSKLE